ncbi:TlpA family protein disulfide reductase [Roseivirga pacifica]|uniref:TlpA family protein disulfide reductase n=1 Tax=Roseivirga pacifica TaxID=1267423 RepID=UPI00227A3ACA|nr:TlpA disulfide reductase family protein [Roseivirga pacifica]
MAEKKKKRISKRDWIELSVIVAIFATIYITGSQAEVFGRVQQVVLKTGVMNATALNEDAYFNADYDFLLVNEKGETVEARSLKGKTIFMNIWATWCPPCVAEMPSINKLYANFKDNENVVFLMISHDREFETAKKWVAQKEFDFPIFQLKTRLPDIYETGVVPSTFVISPAGEIVASKTGMANYNSRRFRKFMEKLSAGEEY